ncbi:MAG: GDSL-type esterase/lipase family protein [Oscillospiraceae bacterium]|nr:GDSL-type esterase/lipase family protein [Oscillospiraceae bacterium]
MSRKSSRRGSREARFGRGLKTALAVFAVVVCMFIGGSTFFIGHGSHVSADSGPARESAPAAESAQPDDKSGGEDAAGGELSGGDETAEDARPSPTPNDCDMLVPESEAVDDSYFDDAVFIGNSRTEGLKKFSGLSNSTFITEVGLTVSSIFTDYCDISGGYRSRAFDALAGMSFSKVYIMLGMNELGWVYESVFKDDYGKIIDKIREINPDAVIYIQSIIPVSKWKDSSNDVFTNANVERLNAQLRDLADEKEVHYLDVAGALMDSEGYLPYEATGDGVHLEPPYCVKWTDYLRTHTAQ